MVVDPDEERRISDRAERLAKMESRLNALEVALARLWYIVAAAALAVTTSVWEAVKAVVFK